LSFFFFRKVEWALRLLHNQSESDPKTATARMQTSSVLFSDVLPTREAMLRLPAGSLSNEEQRAVLLADGPLEQRAAASQQEPMESEDEKLKRLGRPTGEQLQFVVDTLVKDVSIPSARLTLHSTKLCTSSNFLGKKYFLVLRLPLRHF
jgi:hypothetical protein